MFDDVEYSGGSREGEDNHPSELIREMIEGEGQDIEEIKAAVLEFGRTERLPSHPAKRRTVVYVLTAVFRILVDPDSFDPLERTDDEDRVSFPLPDQCNPGNH